MARGRLAPGNEYKQEKEKLEGDSHWGTYKNKKKKSWRGTHTGGPIKTRKRKAGGGLHRGAYKKKKKKSWRGLTQEDL